MTRFARAKGSKASNERREEEATPWQVMRQQLAEQLSSHRAQNENNASYNLKEILNKKNDSKKEEVWSDFGESKLNHSKKINLKTGKTTNKNIKALNNNEPALVLSTGGVNSTINSSNTLSDKSKKSPTIGVRGSNVTAEDRFKTENVSLKKRKAEQVDVEFKVTASNKKHKSENKNKNVCEQFGASKKTKNERLIRKNIFIESAIESNDAKSKYSADNFRTSSENSELNVEQGNSLNGNKKIKKIKNVKSKSTIVLNELPKINEKTTNPTTNSSAVLNNNSTKERKFPKSENTSNYSKSNFRPYNNSENYGVFENNHYRRNNFQTIIANGREIHIVKYQGFFVKKDDAEELKKLRKKLLAENIPKEKLENIMKLERRKAEKALAREKKKVCYHCRQFGHNFSDCPDIKESDMVKTGVCFKCGSLEHSHFECKVLQQQEFRHAVCFVCKEQGHIARQCPLNSQGLYPKGGSCHLCGEVTHLRKDCPKAFEEKPSKGVTLDTLATGTVEDVREQSSPQSEADKKKKKVVQFK